MGVVFELKRIHITNFGLVESCELKLPNMGGLVAIEGRNLDVDGASSNMSGKTTLLNAITWGLYGTNIFGDRLATNVGGIPGVDTRVELTFSSRYLKRKGKIIFGVNVSRTRSGSSTVVKVGFFIQGELSGKLIESGKLKLVGAESDINPEIESLFGSLDLFCTANIYAKGDGFTPFADQTKARKSALFDLLISNSDIDRKAKFLNEYHQKRTSALCKASERKITAEALANQRGLDLVSLKNQLKGLKGTTVIKDTTNEQNELKNVRQQIKEKEAEIIDLQSRLRKAKEDMHAACSPLRENLRRVNDERSVLFARQEQLEESIESLKGLREEDESEVKCTLCGSTLTRKSIKQSIRELQEELDGPVADELKKCERKVTTANSELIDLEKALSGMVSILTAKRDSADVAASSLRIKAFDLDSEIHKSSAEHSIARGELKKQIALTRNRFRKVMSKKFKAQQEELKLTDEVDALNLIRKAFGPNGIRRQRIEAFIPVLNKTALKYSRILFGTSMAVQYAMTREGSTRKEIDEFTVNLVLDGGTIAIAPSSGQRLRRDLVHLFTLCELAENLNVLPIRLIAFDEVFSALDDAGGKVVFDLLTRLQQSSTSLIMVVDHNPEIIGMFHKNLTAVRTGGKVAYSWGTGD